MNSDYNAFSIMIVFHLIIKLMIFSANTNTYPQNSTTPHFLLLSLYLSIYLLNSRFIYPSLYTYIYPLKNSNLSTYLSPFLSVCEYTHLLLYASIYVLLLACQRTAFVSHSKEFKFISFPDRFEDYRQQRECPGMAVYWQLGRLLGSRFMSVLWPCIFSR